MSAVASPDVDIPAIVQRYANGEFIKNLAAEFGIHRSTIYAWMLYETGDQYKDLVRRALARKAANAEVGLEDALDKDDAARARELCRFTRMDYERRCPDVYGVKQQIQQDTSISITIQQLTPQPVVSGPTIIEAQNVSPQQITDQQSEACEGPATEGSGDQK